MPRFVTMGECMLELRQTGEGLLKQGFAGDTFNSAFYARRILAPEWQVEFFSAFGVDPLSATMREQIEALGIETAFSASIEDRQSGLYLIHLDAGERSFSYWRSHSAARLLARDIDRISSVLSGADIALVSGITLAILEGNGADALLTCLDQARRAGTLVAFDPNIRPKLWPNRARMRDLMVRASEICSVALPSFDDETEHFGDATEDATIERFQSCGVPIVVLKKGASGVRVAFDGRRMDISAPRVDDVVDTTGAGDSFNGVFLARLALGDDPEAAARHAVAVAAEVVRYHGALMSVDPAFSAHVFQHPTTLRKQEM